jgi:uncharacterized protein YjgD (DUF1641 family)
MEKVSDKFYDEKLKTLENKSNELTSLIKDLIDNLDYLKWDKILDKYNNILAQFQYLDKITKEKEEIKAFNLLPKPNYIKDANHSTLKL